MQEKTIRSLPLPLTSTGTFNIKPDEIIWTTTQPIKTILTINDQGLDWDKQSTPEKKPGESEIAKLFLTAIKGDIQQLQTIFDIQPQGTIKDWHLSLTPKNKKLSIYIKKIDISGSHFTEIIKIIETNGDSTVIHLDAKQYN
ncbi:MAG: outer membrane lipoprotein carrier protein LolA [Cellvibrionaceae bacterium]